MTAANSAFRAAHFAAVTSSGLGKQPFFFSPLLPGGEERLIPAARLA